MELLRFEEWVLEFWPNLSGLLGSLSWQCSVPCPYDSHSEAHLL